MLYYSCTQTSSLILLYCWYSYCVSFCALLDGVCLWGNKRIAFFLWPDGMLHGGDLLHFDSVASRLTRSYITHRTWPTSVCSSHRRWSWRHYLTLLSEDRDDTANQLYVSYHPGVTDTARQNPSVCAADFFTCCVCFTPLSANCRQNRSLVDRFQASSVKELTGQDLAITVGSETIHPCNVVRDLKVWLDSELLLKQCVNKIAGVCYSQLRRIHRGTWNLPQRTGQGRMEIYFRTLTRWYADDSAVKTPYV